MKAVLVWAVEKKEFLKITEGTGDNLSAEDRAEGYCDYVMWNLFNIGELAFDEEWCPATYNPSHP